MDKAKEAMEGLINSLIQPRRERKWKCFNKCLDWVFSLEKGFLGTGDLEIYREDEYDFYYRTQIPLPKEVYVTLSVSDSFVKELQKEASGLVDDLIYLTQERGYAFLPVAHLLEPPAEDFIEKVMPLRRIIVRNPIGKEKE